MTHEEDGACIAKFISSLDTAEKVQANDKKVRALWEQLDSGGPIQPVSASDLKQLWDASRCIKADMPLRPDTAIGLGVYAACGVDAAADPERMMAVHWRHTVLSDLVDRGFLDSYFHDNEPEEKVFAAAAAIPCNEEDLHQVLMKQLFSQLPPEQAAQAKEAMRSEGCDPDRPKIAAKFLDLLRRTD
jgi:hypothetical protein